MGLQSKSSHGGKPYTTGELLSDQAGTTTGVWYALSGIEPLSVTFEDTVGDAFVGTVRLHVSNRDSQPAAADPGVQIGDDVTTLPEHYHFTRSWRWIKASVPSYTSGTLKAVGVWAGPGT